MLINFRVKVKANSIDDLTKHGLAVNKHDCGDKEYYVVGPDAPYLKKMVKEHKLMTISEIEKL